MYHIVIGFAEESIRKNRNDKYIDDERNKEGNASFDQEVRICLADS